MESSEKIIGVKTRSMKDQDRVIPARVKRNYCHISKLKKIQLIQTVLKQKCRIKKIAKDLNINYATAKTILHCYKKKQIHLDGSTSFKRAGIAEVNMNCKMTIQIKEKEHTIRQYEYFEELKKSL